MATPQPLPLQERVIVKNTTQRVLDILIFSLLFSLLAYRLGSFHGHGMVWYLAFICESWFTFVWGLYVSTKWNQVFYKTYLGNLLKKIDDLPAIDMFVTTADPNLEPPIITVNTVLSLLAAQYPAHKLACYVSDDAGSPITYHSLSEASKFARLWVPFCKRHNVSVRAPFMYFSQLPKPSDQIPSDEFTREWKEMKEEYEELSQRIEDAGKKGVPCQMDGELKDFKNIERGNHESIIKVIWENKDGENGVPHLVYVAREKRPKHPHHYKAGAMNVLTRVSGVTTNAPFMLNLDCDMFVNNPETLLRGMCLLLGFDDEVYSGFVQTIQQFYGTLKDDPFGNQLVVLQTKLGLGFQGIQGPMYAGTGCFHRRKIIYGTPPDNEEINQLKRNGELSNGGLERVFGHSKELIESVDRLTSKPCISSPDISTRIEAAKQVAACTYDHNTSWGKEIGWVYGSTTEDVLTGLRIHSMGWRSVYLFLDPPPFLGGAPTGGPASLTQFKRWSTGMLEILLSRNSPIIAALTKRLLFRQCLGYMVVLVWALRSVFELCYALLPAYCLLANTSFMPSVWEREAAIPAALFIMFNAYNVIEYKQCGLSLRSWWNNQRMLRISAMTAFLFGFLSVVLKLLGLSETVFEVTKKEQSGPAGGDEDEEPGRFTFDASPVFIPGTVVVLVHLVALGSAVAGMAGGGRGPGLAELGCSAWVVLSFWPFVRGLVGKGRYGIPWSVVWKAGVVASVFMQLCR